MNIEQYLLIKLMEEAAEVQQACAKALRFGLRSTNNGTKPSNLESLQSEFKDMNAVL
jgi:NTP pyrophosphatase (non-canonical NTP hydrolase)